MRPTDVNGINKAAGENYHLVYNNVFGVRACSLRLTNVYGPRQLLKHNRQGFIGWFIRLAIEGREIPIYGDGSQLRDFVFVDDAADAFLRAGASDRCNGQVFNVGGAEPIAHKALVELLIGIAGSGQLPAGRVARREEGDRHRRLLRRLVALPADRRAGGRRRRSPRAWPRTDRVLPRALRALRAVGVPGGRPVTGSRADPFRRAAARRAIGPTSPRPSSACSARGWFVLGPEVEAFEAEFAAASGAAHAVGVASGTDAIALALRALGIGPGDEVIVPAHDRRVHRRWR